MNIYPFIVLFAEPIITLQDIILAFNFLKSAPLLLKMLSLFIGCFSNTFINKILQLRTRPKWDNVNIFWELLSHISPNTTPISR